MTEAERRALADALFREHADRRPYRQLEGAERPASLAEAYEVQRLLLARFQESGRGAVVGYKVGLTSRAIREMCKTDQPVGGAIFANTVRRSPARIRLADFLHVGLEFELAVELGAPFLPEDAPFTRADAADRVAACMPAFELVDDRNADYDRIDALTLVADNAWCDGVVLGPRSEDWRALDLAQAPVSLRINDAPPETETTGAAMGHPLNSLAWLANGLASRGEGLEAGMTVMTGSTFATRFPVTGDRFRYEIGGLGTVEAEIV